MTVEEANLASVQPAQDVTLTVPAYPGVNFPAKVVTVAPSGDPRAHTFDVKIVPIAQDQRLLPGMFAQAQIVAQQKPDALLVPKEAIVQQGTQQVVFVADNGRAVATPVKTGMTNDTSVEITSGLAPGAQVVVIGQNGLRTARRSRWCRRQVRVARGRAARVEVRARARAARVSSSQPRPRAARQRAWNRPRTYSCPLRTAIRRSTSGSALGRHNSRMPSRYTALIAEPSTSCGRLRDRSQC